MEPIVPFGKYKGKPITELLADTSYVNWAKQNGLFEKFTMNINIVQQSVVNQDSPTPEHNKFQKIQNIKDEIIETQNTKYYNTHDDNDYYGYSNFNEKKNKKIISLKNELLFIENNIIYEINNNVITIKHKITNTKLRRSLVNNKTFYKSEWKNNISINLIISWYNSDYDILDDLI